MLKMSFMIGIKLHMAFEISKVPKIRGIVRILSFSAWEAINLWTIYVNCICKNTSGIQEKMKPK